MPLIGAYLPPSSLDHLPDLEAALASFNGALNVTVMGDLNADIHDLTHPRHQQVANLLANYGLLDLLNHFRQRRPFRHMKTWYQVREGVLLRSRCDYILGTDRRLFESVGLRDPQQYSTDHLMLRGRLLRQPTKSHNRYLRGRRKFPLRLPKFGPLTQADTMFQDIKQRASIPRLAHNTHPRPQWISPATIRLIDQRCSLRRNKFHNRATARQLTRQIKAGLKLDRKRRTEAAATQMANLLAGEDPDLQGAYTVLKRWYKHATARQPKPSRENLESVAQQYRQLYTAEDPTPPGDPVPVHVHPFPICDAVPSESEVKSAVRRLKPNKAPGPSRLKAEVLRKWLLEAFPEESDNEVDWEKPANRSNWDPLLHLVTHMWATGEIPTELTWQILVLIPKGTPGDGSRGIGLLETVWKLMEAIMDTRVKEVVVFHDFLHGFRTNRGTGTAILEVKLAQELACIEQAPLYMVFLDLRKAYDTVDRSRALEVFEQYGMGPRMLRLLRNFWSNQQVIPRQSGYHGPVFTATRGHTQGGLFSPTKFNIVADCVVREWLATAVGDDGHPAAADGFGTTIRDRLNILYADDDVLGSRDAGWLQHGLQVLVDLFRRMGLSANEVKTKAMVCLPGNIRSCLTESAYTRRTTGTGASYRARLQARTCWNNTREPL